MKKKPVFKSILLMIGILWFAGISYSQDTLFIKGEGKKVTKILEIGPKEISYKMADYMDGPTFRVEKEKVDLIKFGNGTIEYFASQVQPAEKPKPVDSQDPEERMTHLGKPVKSANYYDGSRDAQIYYKGFKGAGTGSFIGGVFTIYGLPVPIVTSLTPASSARFYVPDQDLYFRNRDYAAGFDKQAHRIKAGKAWTNYGLGFVTTVGVTTVLLIAALGNIF